MDSSMQEAHISSACFQSSPGHIRAVGHLYGVQTVPVERARLLEVGCEAGGNLLPFVLAYPDAQAVGVDLSSELIACGQTVVQELNIGNLKLLTIDPGNLSSLGEFDYILVRGMFSGVAETGRKELLHICRSMLSPKGVLYFQYSTYPGAKLDDVVRDAVLLHGHAAETHEQKLGSVRAVLSLLSDGVATSHPMISSVQEVVAETKSLSDHVLTYKYIQGLNASCYFLEFVDAAREAGMAYLGDAEPQIELPVSYGPNVQLNTSLLAMGQPRVMRQQYLDFAVGRKLRRSLLVSEEREAEIFSGPDFSRLADLNWAASYRTAIARPGAPLESVQYIGTNGESFSCNDKLEISIIDALSQAWPRSLSFEALKLNVEDIISASMGEDSQEQHVRLQNALESLFKRGILRYSLGPGPYDTCSNDRLSLIPGLAYTLDLVGKTSIRPGGFNLWHQGIDYRLDDVESSALPLLNGTKNFQQLVGQLNTSFAERGSGEASAAKGVSGPTLQIMPAEKKLARLIDSLRYQGALMGSSTAWVSYFRSVLAIYSTDGYEGLRYIGPIVLFSSQKEIGGLGASILVNSSGLGGRGSAARSGRPSKSIISEAERKIKRLMAKRQFSDAQGMAWRIAEDQPDQASSWELLCRVLLSTAEQPKEALVPLLRAIALRPKASYCHSDLGLVLRHQGLLKEAEVSVRRALRLNPENDKAWLQLGMAVSDSQQQNEAEFCYRYALTLKPDSAHAHNNLANVCANQQHLEEAISHYRRAIEIQPNLLDAYSNLLFTLTHDESIGANELFMEHRSFGLLMEKTVGKPDFNYPGSRMNGRRLRIGFVSADLRNHAVAHFIEPVWRELDKENFEIHAYSNSLWEDGVSARLRTHTATWHQVSNNDDLSLAQRIRDDGIDILFDLSGHSARNRLAAFAYRPAPIQVSWIGYPGTTGLQAVDYYMIGKDIAPPGLLDAQFTEKLVYLPSSVRFEPAAGSPEVNPLPALGNDTFTFASFNRPGKLGKAMIALWAEVLAAVPNSKLLLGNILSKTTSEALQTQFLAHGVVSERLIFCDRVPLPDYLHMHHRVDLLLDTLPYAGGTTTCHGLWMGVPTLTLAGETLAGRQGVALMKQFGLDQFVAYSNEDYVEKALTWSRDLKALAEIRIGLRETIGRHYATSQVGMARCVEVAMQRMWERWSKGQSPESFTVQV